MKRWWVAPLAIALVACEPADQSGTVKAWVFARDPQTNAYSLSVQPVEHLDSLRELRGANIDVLRNTSLTDSLTGTDIDRGQPFSLEYSVDSNGAVVPGDEGSLQALTLYRNIDTMAELMKAHGHTPSQKLVVYFMPHYDNILLGDARLEFTDNAAYASIARGFIIVPSFVLSDLPMMLNEGVIAHEFGHSVIHQELFGDAKEEPNAASTEHDWMVIHRHLLAMHEGVADLFGFARTGDPDFIRSTANVDRNLSVPQTLTSQQALEMNDVGGNDQILGLSTYDPHVQGSVLARTIFELWPRNESGAIDEAGRGRLIDVILATLRKMKADDAYNPAHAFTLATFPNDLVLQLTGEERKNACAVLLKRLAPLSTSLTNCEAQ